jgi:benzil reductase ((S)-benzoin forming)
MPTKDCRVFITGVSKGLGEATANIFLENGYLVTGIGRSHAIDHDRFTFISCDLKNRQAVKELSFEAKEKEIILINNAGVIGAVQRLIDQKISDVEEVMLVNAMVPMMLSQLFLKKFAASQKLTIANISSGAATRPIPSWAAYCSSKAALNVFSETIQLEQIEKGFETRVLAISPGVLDTVMQAKIRAANKNDFSSVEIFHELQKNQELVEPLKAAQKLFKLLISSNNQQVICSLRDIEG